MKVSAQKIGYAIEWLGSWEKSLEALVKDGTISDEEKKQELAYQRSVAKTKRNQKKESELTANELKEFRKQKKKLAKPLYSIKDNAHLEDIYFNRVTPEYHREINLGLPPLDQ